MKDTKEIVVIRKHECDFCGEEGAYDGKTKMGPWAVMCQGCFKRYGVGLGTGKGQKLVEKKNDH